MSTPITYLTSCQHNVTWCMTGQWTVFSYAVLGLDRTRDYIGLYNLWTGPVTLISLFLVSHFNFFVYSVW